MHTYVIVAACKCKIKIKKTKFNEDFNYDPDTGEILACPVNGKHILPITVCFSPRFVIFHINEVFLQNKYKCTHTFSN